MRRPARHVKLLVFTAFTLFVLSFVSPFRRKGDDSGEAAGTKAAALRQQQQKKDGYNVKGSPSIEGEHDAGAGGVGPLNIKYVALIAERHSGSTWMTRLLKDYFRGKDVKVISTLCSWKHWFQDRIHEDIQAGNRSCREKEGCAACMDIEHTLVIAMWRNPYDWASGMQVIPHHAKEHAHIEDFTTFITKRWMLAPEEEKRAREEAERKARDEKPCIHNYLPGEVLPCWESDRHAIYELGPGGEVYGNVYDLRKAKIRDFNAVKSWAPYYEKILYEDILEGDGLRAWLKSLETLYGLSGDYEGVKTPELASYMEGKLSEMYYTNSENCTPRCMMGGGDTGRRAVETMHQLWDEELEAEIGYHRLQQH